MTNAQLNGCSLDGWECFHCRELFTTIGGARDHFGAKPTATPACLIKKGAELGLVMELRKAEERIVELETMLHSKGAES